MHFPYTAIDFETANGYRTSICQIGLVRIENQKIVKQLSILVQPPDNSYWNQFTAIHGITAKKTAKAPTFDRVWKEIEPFIKNQQVVAHNGFSFDFDCLAKTLEYYNLPTPEYSKHCTLKIYRKGLGLLCQELNIPLNHHDALSDARACAELFKRHLEK